MGSDASLSEMGHFRSLPHFKNESSCETFQMKMSLISVKVDVQVRLTQ